MKPADQLPGGGHATLNGVEGRYRLCGQGPLCVLLSGGADTPPPLLESLSAFLTLVIPNPQQVNRLPALLDHLGHGRAMVMGVGKGDRQALHFAVEHPDQVAQLILTAPPDPPVNSIRVPTIVLPDDSDAWPTTIRNFVFARRDQRPERYS